MTRPVTVLLLAGRRPGIDRLAAHFGVLDKALIEIAGEAMLSRVARTLIAHPGIGRILVLGDARLAYQPELGWMADEERIGFAEARGSIADTLGWAIEAHRDDSPFLLTTADNPLLDHRTIDFFIAGAQDCDLAAGLVERRVLLSAYPASKRTWLKFRGGAYSGANLFWLSGPQVLPLLQLWGRVEQQRKRGRAVLGAFGPLLLAGIALRLLSLDQASARVARRFKVSARPVILPYAEACIDVDKPADHALATGILIARNR